ncbi:hypothetical protein N7508_005821 [Penicillium antarcticum]|uniref:uncharacterized protein n=1 Tax=Penicillium antarcticum TaxID=416450 RepID=UPI002389A470|nr:uncharacterized protein N7508_005821 [Penicillium antarcticum]KAJ5306806.1 hypothetical protein N7508_005821 [Penicillium antarcticum]
MGSMLSRPRSNRDITIAVRASRNLELQDVGSLNAASESGHASMPTSSASSISTSTATHTQTPKSTAFTNETNQQPSKISPKEQFPQIRIYRIKSKSKSKNKTKTNPKSNLSNIGVLLIVMPPMVRIHGWTRDSLLVGELPRLKGFSFRSEKELDYGLLSASEALDSVISQLDTVIGFERLFSWRL